MFEWDEEKEQKNIDKHGISFRLAKKVFDDPYFIELYDDVHSTYEDRYAVIGYVGEVLFVVYTLRGENIRIISARLATPLERRYYYGNSLLR